MWNVEKVGVAAVSELYAMLINHLLISIKGAVHPASSVLIHSLHRVTT